MQSAHNPSRTDPTIRSSWDLFQELGVSTWAGVALVIDDHIDENHVVVETGDPPDVDIVCSEGYGQTLELEYPYLLSHLWAEVADADAAATELGAVHRHFERAEENGGVFAATVGELLEGIRLSGPWLATGITEGQRDDLLMALYSRGLDAIVVPPELEAWVVVFQSDSPVASHLRLASAALARRR